MMDMSVDETTDYAAESNQQHGIKRHRAIQRAYPEGRMEQDEQRTDNPGDHVKLEPGLHFPQAFQGRHPFAQRVQEQTEHQQTTDQAQVVAKIGPGIKQLASPDQPRQKKQQRDE